MARGVDAVAWEVDLSLCDGLVAVSAPPAVWTIRRHHMWKAFALNGFGVAGGDGHEEVVAPEFVRCDCGHFLLNFGGTWLPARCLACGWGRVWRHGSSWSHGRSTAMSGRATAVAMPRAVTAPGESALSLSLPDEAGRSHPGRCTRETPLTDWLRNVDVTVSTRRSAKSVREIDR